MFVQIKKKKQCYSSESFVFTVKPCPLRRRHLGRMSHQYRLSRHSVGLPGEAVLDLPGPGQQQGEILCYTPLPHSSKVRMVAAMERALPSRHSLQEQRWRVSLVQSLASRAGTGAVPSWSRPAAAARSPAAPAALAHAGLPSA